MNHLAHAFLAREKPNWIVGSLIADSRHRPTGLPQEILQGIALHQKIDGFADKNEKFREIRAALRPAAGLYAGVMADICCDNLLIAQWERYSELPLTGFTADVYKAMHVANGYLPGHLRSPRASPKIDWLAGYARREGLEQAMLRVRAKVASTRRFPDIDAVLDLYFARRDELSDSFRKFFDELTEKMPEMKKSLI